MHSFISELRAEGVTYVAPWRPPAQQAVQSTEEVTQPPAAADAIPSDEEETEGAVGYNLATTSSDFGSMSLEEAATLERARKSQYAVLHTFEVSYGILTFIINRCFLLL